MRMLLPNVLYLVPDVEKLQSDLKKEQEQLQDTKKTLGAVHLLLCQKANGMLMDGYTVFENNVQ